MTRDPSGGHGGRVEGRLEAVESRLLLCVVEASRGGLKVGSAGGTTILRGSIARVDDLLLTTM